MFKLFQGNSLLKAARFFGTLKKFGKSTELAAFLNAEKPVFSVLYFRAKWNHQCTQADAAFKKLADQHSGIEFIELDTDLDDRFKTDYGIKCEPEFIITCLGCDMVRHYGLGLEKLEEKIQKVTDFYKSCEFLGNSGRYQSISEEFQDYYEENLREEDWWLR